MTHNVFILANQLHRNQSRGARFVFVCEL